MQSRSLKRSFPVTVALTALILGAAVFAVSVRPWTWGHRRLVVLGEGLAAPELKSFETVSDREILMNFSEDVTLSECAVRTQGGESLAASTSCEGGEARISLAEATELGESYVLEGVAEDAAGSSLTFSVGFKGKNANPARLIMTEVRNAYGVRSIRKQKVHRSEFVELYVLKSGNLAGFEIYSAADGDKKKYEFPAIDVEAGEYVVVHMRTVDKEGIDGEGMISETGDNLSLSTHEDSRDGVRDLWSANTESVFAPSDIVVLRETESHKVHDAILFAKSDLEAWSVKAAALGRDVEKSGVWQGGVTPQNAISSDLVTTSAATRSYARQGLSKSALRKYREGEAIPNGREHWLVARGASPGDANSSEPYVKRTKN